ncbi:YkvI family membrane protein [Corticicoccus populi]|uniref:Membrane protein YkvI n=1 Tax=Corticicoccus populi TaxID=1812821 RepID=A0ABW5WQ09_9STAP
MSYRRESIVIGFAYTGVVVGAGFSTGQEILQFFTNYGTWSYAAIILSALVIMFIGRQASKVGYRLKADSHQLPIYAMFGTKAGKVIDYVLVFFLYGIAVIMLAGAGSAFHESFGISPWLGSLIMLVAVFATLLLDFNKIMVALGGVTPFLVLFILIIAAFNIFSPSIPFSEVNEHTQIDRSPSGLWWWDAVTYSGLTLATAFSFLSIMGSEASKHKAARRGGIVGGIIIMLLMFLINGGLLANIEEANNAALPTLLLANDVHPVIGIGLSIVMLLVIYNTAVGLMYPFLTRFSTPYSRKYKVLMTIGLLFGYLLSFVGFVDLVNIFYPIFGYIGLLIGAALTVRWFMNKFSKKKLV